MMHVTYDKRMEHADALRHGLVKLGRGFLAELCYWCEGKTMRLGEGHCHVCGHEKPYGTALGLLTNGQPTPESVVNQVLVAGEYE